MQLVRHGRKATCALGVVVIYVAAVISPTAASVSDVTPVQKVIEMLNGMVEKGKASQHAEQVEFAAFKQFCTDVTTDKQRRIKAAEMQVEMLTADMKQRETNVERLEGEIDQHHADIANWKKDADNATSDRETARSDYMSRHQDLSESVSAIREAIAVLKKQAFDRPQAAAMLQAVEALGKVPAAARRAIQAFLAQDPEVGDPFSPEANGYEFQSQSIIDMLEKLEDKFVDERTQAEKDEVESRHTYQTLSQDLRHSIKVANQQIQQKSEAKAKDLQAVAQLKLDLGDETATMKDDRAYLDDLVATCQTKSTAFEDRQALRVKELETLAQAVELLSGKAVAGAAEKHLPAVLAQRRAPALVQLRAQRTQVPDQVRAAAFLHEEGTRLGSRVLAVLALRAQDDPFAKVKAMIQQLIERLMAQATAEADHKGWCDSELSANQATRTEKSSAVEMLRSEIDELHSTIAKLGQEIADLSSSLAELESAVAKATAMREAEKAKNAATVADAAEAQTAVSQAIALLKDFYGTAATATALAQKRQAPPATPTSPYTGMQGESGGVIGMLEVIQSDFARLESETSNAETTADTEYSEFMNASEVDREQKQQDIDHKKSEKTLSEQRLTESQADLDSTEKELESANRYFEKLKPSCLEAGTTYGQRVERRKEEIQALREALRILNGEDLAALQQS